MRGKNISQITVGAIGHRASLVSISEATPTKQEGGPNRQAGSEKSGQDDMYSESEALS